MDLPALNSDTERTAETNEGNAERHDEASSPRPPFSAVENADRHCLMGYVLFILDRVT
jgi:hypothetical protein